MSEFGFFFFLRMAVAVSSFCGGSVLGTAGRWAVILTSLTSAPDGSLRDAGSAAASSYNGGGEWTYFDRSTLGVV